MLAARFLGLVAFLVALLCFGGTATAAQTNEFSFDRADGQVLAVGGGEIEVGVECGLADGNECHGRVSVVPRGKAVAALGSKALADSGMLSADPGGDLEPRLRVEEAALDWLRKEGPLPVTAVVHRSGGPTISKSMFIAKVEFLKGPAPEPRLVATTSNSELVTKTYRWDITLRAGTAKVLREFRCPGNASYVAEGPKGSRAGTAGDIRITASEGVGYGAFDDPIVKPFWDQLVEYRQWTLHGWYEGGFWHNNVFAPLFKGGTFSMTVLCTNSNPSGFDSDGGNTNRENYVGNPRAASIDQLRGKRSDETYPVELLLPWKVG